VFLVRSLAIHIAFALLLKRDVNIIIIMWGDPEVSFCRSKSLWWGLATLDTAAVRAVISLTALFCCVCFCQLASCFWLFGTRQEPLSQKKKERASHFLVATPLTMKKHFLGAQVGDRF
jgi:hypothetical protein